jgi:hypothetical protein
MMEGGRKNLSQQITRSLVVCFGDAIHQVPRLCGNFHQFGLRDAGRGPSGKIDTTRHQWRLTIILSIV